MTSAWLVLNAIKGLGPVRIKALLEVYGTPEAVLKAPHQDIARRAGLPAESLQPVEWDELHRDAEEQMRRCQKNGVTILTLDHEHYPPLLREIFAPPPVLFVKGSMAAFRRHAVALVGTRRPTAYGRSVAAHLARDLVGQSLAITSGLALGIDTVVHQCCLDAHGITIAVLGCGIDRIYPAENARLADQILKTGALVSEFPLGTPPEAYNFPRRNRIISGLSAGVVVIESGEKGGALITAQYALQQGREVFAVPGSIFSDKSAGTHALIRSGATPVRSAADITEQITSLTHARLTPATPTPVVQPSLELLSAQERLMLEALSAASLRVDQLAEQTRLGIGELPSVLLNLELRGLVRQRAGNLYERVGAS